MFARLKEQIQFHARSVSHSKRDGENLRGVCLEYLFTPYYLSVSANERLTRAGSYRRAIRNRHF